MLNFRCFRLWFCHLDFTAVPATNSSFGSMSESFLRTFSLLWDNCKTDFEPENLFDWPIGAKPLWKCIGTAFFFGFSGKLWDSLLIFRIDPGRVIISDFAWKQNRRYVRDRKLLIEHWRYLKVGKKTVHLNTSVQICRKKLIANCRQKLVDVKCWSEEPQTLQTLPLIKPLKGHSWMSNGRKRGMKRIGRSQLLKGIRVNLNPSLKSIYSSPKENLTTSFAFVGSLSRNLLWP